VAGVSAEATSQVIICAWCGKMFDRTYSAGPAPKYCKKAHREAAYRSRVLERADAVMPADMQLRITELLTDRYGFGKTWSRVLAQDIVAIMQGED